MKMVSIALVSVCMQHYMCRMISANVIASSDINECDNPSVCHPNATCEDNEGSYSCHCEDGFSGDGNFNCRG